MSRADSPLRDRVVFVVGARRSGTNWLERVLTGHPEVVAVPTETYLFSHGVQPLAERFQHANPRVPTISRMYMPRDEFLDAVRDFTDRALVAALDGAADGARYIVERTPWHASHLPLIAAVYPDARIVNIVRDGRAVARSLVAMPWGPSSIEEAAAEWRASVRDARAGAANLDGRARDVVYERMLADPRGYTGDLFEWLGLELTDGVWADVLAAAGSEFNVDPGSPGVRTDKWRDELSASELRAFERIAGDELDALGYERAAPPGAPSRAERARQLVGDDRLRKLATVAREPRATLRGAYERSFARRLNADEVALKEVCSRFERFVAEGSDEAARELLDPALRVKLDDGGGDGTVSLRGGAAADALLAALADHRERGLRTTGGEFHATAHGATSLTRYSLDDGSSWTRTLVYKVRDRSIREAALYRYELRSG